MGRTRLYPDNATRQREWQRKQREKELQVKIEEAQKIKTVAQSVDNFDEEFKRYFIGKTFEEVKESYEKYKSLYRILGVNILFQEITHYLDNETSLFNGLTIGDMEYFLSVVEDHIPCPICDYHYSHLESNGCPECSLRLSNYKAWLSYRKSYMGND